ncbi:MAG: hypothetical protein AAF654_02880 [Myxococcota bacterium]
MPKTQSTAVRRLQRWAPPFVYEVLSGLARAGGQGFLVGGVVRDAFLNRRGADWDIATDLTPDRVAESFPRVARTGEKHGTILVIDAGGENGVEVTTFRGEGPYLDGRRPSFVEFHQEIHQDLARRDFTMNAIAADLVAGNVEDPFRGIGDIEAKCIRCVGDPLARFREDGLRPLRAVRFASTLSFIVHPGTEAALGAAMEVFEKVAWERKRVELEKLLLGAAVRESVALLGRSGLLGAMAPELSERVNLDPLVRLPTDAWLRFTEWGLACGLDADALGDLAQRFRASTATRKRVQGWANAARLLPGPVDGAAFRRWLAAVGVDAARGAIEIQRARGGDADWYARSLRKLRRPPPHRVLDLAVSGADLQALGITGPRVGYILRVLLERVIESPARNRKAVLLKVAHTLSTET